MTANPERGQALEFETPPHYDLSWLKFGISSSALQTRPFRSDMSDFAKAHFHDMGLLDYDEFNPRHDLHEAEDLKLLAESGVKYFRQSFEWAEFFPDGPYTLNLAAVEKARQYILDCRKLGIEVWPMLSHFTAPTWLPEHGGWRNPATAFMFEYFVRCFLYHLGPVLDQHALVGIMNEPLTLAAYIMAGKSDADADRSPTELYLETRHLVDNLEFIINCGRQAILDYQQRHPGCHFEPVVSHQLSPVYAIDENNLLDRLGAKLANHWQNTMFLKRLKGNICAIQYYRTAAVKLTRPTGANKVNEAEAETTNRIFCFEITMNGIGVEEFRSENGWPVDVLGLEKSILMAKKVHPDQQIVIYEEGYGGLKKPKDLTPEDEVKWRRRDDLVRIYQILVNFLTIAAVKQKYGIEVFGNFHWTLTRNNELGRTDDFGLVYWDPETDARTPRPAYYVYQKIANDKAVDLNDVYDLISSMNYFEESDIENLKHHIKDAQKLLGLNTPA